jgi:putative FmdB family regulatory protein
MPIYEYTCQACNKKFDQLARTMTSTDQQDKVPCPECGSKKTARAMSVFAVGSEGARSASSEAPMCGRCGGAEGSCGMG